MSEQPTVFLRFRNAEEPNPHDGDFDGAHATLAGAQAGAPSVEIWSDRQERWVGSDGETHWVIYEFDIEP